MNKNALIVFVRKPERGKVKTRLAATIGEDAALYVYQKLLTHTASVVKETGVNAFVFYAGEIAEDDVWNEMASRKRQQSETDLGHRMQTAFETVFAEGCSQVVIIGSDCPQLTANHVQAAFDQLQKHDVVIGPAADGGYYLLGMKRVHAALFQNIAWSTPLVYAQTTAVLQTNRLTFFSLPSLTDVDEEKDLPLEWKEEIKRLFEKMPGKNNSI